MSPPLDDAPAGSARNITGLILAGGRGARMDERDKGLLEWRGRPLIAHVRERLAPQVDGVLVSANRNLDRYADYGDVVRDDAQFGAWQGPLAGVAAGIAACRTPWLAVVPCDTPCLPADLVARLSDGAAAAGAPLAVACAGGRRHSVCMLLRVSLLPGLLAYLRGGARRVDTWQGLAGGVEVGFARAEGFYNINTPDQLVHTERDSESLPDPHTQGPGAGGRGPGGV